jgi:formylglycine-generating enzyme required for sulfatase activity
MRGGSWASEYKDLHLLVVASRLWNSSYVSSDVLGFRCAMHIP